MVEPKRKATEGTPVEGYGVIPIRGEWPFVRETSSCRKNPELAWILLRILKCLRYSFFMALTYSMYKEYTHRRDSLIEWKILERFHITEKKRRGEGGKKWKSENNKIKENENII